MYVCTLIYGVKPSGQQCQVSLEKLAAHFKQQGESLEGASVLEKDTYVDDIITSPDSMQDSMFIAGDIERILARGSMGVKAFSYSGAEPSERVSGDGVHVGLGGYLWATKEDEIKLNIGPPRLGKARRGRPPPAVTGDFGVALRANFTRRVLTGLVAGVFDPLGLVTPITAGMKLDLHVLCQLKLDWDDPVPDHLLDKWVQNMHQIQELRNVNFRRTVIPLDAVNTEIQLLVLTDASQNLGIVAIFGRVLRQNGLYSCQLILGRSKLLTGLTIPKAELKAAVAGAVTASVVKRNLGDKFSGATYCTDSTVALYWISNDDRPLQVGVRNAVCEIRRFSDPHDWYHITTDLNVADLGTRAAEVSEIMPGTAWQSGQDWMHLPRDQQPLRTVSEITLTSEEKRLAAAETRAGDVQGLRINIFAPDIAARYAESKYLVDPCKFSWSKSRRILALALRFVSLCKGRSAEAGGRGNPMEAVKDGLARPACVISDQELEAADRYFFKLYYLKCLLVFLHLIL
jgi:hypothetical protein